MVYIYSATNSINGKVYIGQTNDFKSRKKSHFYAHNRKSYFYRALRKHGEKHFDWEILQTTIDESAANKYEKYYIEYFNSTDSEYGYNLTDGGRSNFHFNDVIKNKIATKQKEWSQKNPEKREALAKILVDWRKNNPERNRKENNPMWGKHHTEDTRQRIKKNHFDNSGKNNGQYIPVSDEQIKLCIDMWHKNKSISEISRKILGKENKLKIKKILWENNINTEKSIHNKYNGKFKPSKDQIDICLKLWEDGKSISYIVNNAKIIKNREQIKKILISNGIKIEIRLNNNGRRRNEYGQYI